MARQHKIRIWSEAKLIDTFDLRKTKIPTPLMTEWLNATTQFSEFELLIMQKIHHNAVENIEAWAEEDLKMNFIAFVIDLAGLQATRTIRTFYDKTISATVEGIYLKTKTDFMMAKGVLDLMKNLYTVVA